VDTPEAVEPKQMRLEFDPDNVRAEYAAVNSYSSTVATFRFTLVGFFLAAVGLVVRDGIPRDDALLLLALSLCLWILELRNRALLGNLSGRALQIERDIWGYSGSRAYDGFVSRQMKSRPADDADAPEPPRLDVTRIFFWKARLPVSHTLGLDLMYLSVAIYAITKIW